MVPSQGDSVSTDEKYKMGAVIISRQETLPSSSVMGRKEVISQSKITMSSEENSSNSSQILSVQEKCLNDTVILSSEENVRSTPSIEENVPQTPSILENVLNIPSIDENPPKTAPKITFSSNTDLPVIFYRTVQNGTVQYRTDTISESSGRELRTVNLEDEACIAIEQVDDLELQNVEYVNAMELGELANNNDSNNADALLNIENNICNDIEITGNNIEDTESAAKVIDKVSCPWKGCYKTYSTHTHMKVHYRTHTGEKPFVCSFKGCSKTFTAGYSLKAHSRVHTGETPYHCPEETCDKRFKTGSDLKKHWRVHSGEKPFVCDVCDVSFTTSSIRKVHVRTHTGERPYSCDKCHKTFSSQTNLQNHRRIHLGQKPFSCEVSGCGKSFTEYSSLHKHKTVHNVRPSFSCSLCGKVYKHMATMEKHKRVYHGIVESVEDQKIEEVVLPSDISGCFEVITEDVISDDPINLAEIVIENSENVTLSI